MLADFLFMAGGRPRTYEDPEELQKAVDDYFAGLAGSKTTSVNLDGTITEKWDKMPEPATITGLALALGFESRQSVYDYDKEGQFSYIIKNARLRVECEYEKKLTTAQSPTGSIFALKNMGWKDKFEQDVNHSGISFTFNPAPGCEPIKDA